MSVNNFFKQKLTNIFTAQMQKIIERHNPKIVAVAGSVGKTTTKVAIAKVLSAGLRVRYQDGNYNTFISVPFIFIGQSMPPLYNPFAWLKVWLDGQKTLNGKYPFDVVVVELGIDAPGDMQVFSETIHPDVAVLSAVCEEHMEFFKTLDAVAKEELLIAKFSDLLIFNQDDVPSKYLDKYLPTGSQVCTYGLKNGQYKLDPVQRPGGFYVNSDTSHGKIKDIRINNITLTYLKSISAAVAVADKLGLTGEQIAKGISTVMPMPGRMQMLKGIKNSLVIDDTYNSSPLAVEAALDSLYQLSGKAGMQRIAILGSMNELGAYSKEAHVRVGSYCDPKKLDLLITIGKHANEYTASVAEAKGIKVIRCDSPYQAGDVARMNLEEGATVLAKGSQNGVYAEEAIKLLLANPDDSKKLVRQNKFWVDKKRAQFKDFK